jgi:hypothetical protein
VTLLAAGKGELLLKELLGCAVGEGLMRPDSVVDSLPGQDLRGQLCYCPSEVPDLIELLCMGALRPFHVAVELGGAGWEDEQPYLASLTLDLEGGVELRSPIYLDGAHGEGHAGLDSIQEGDGGSSGSPAVYLQDVPAGDHIAGGEVLEDDSR